MASGLTPTYLIPFPLATDPVDVHGDVQDLAERVDDVLGLKAGTDEANTFTYPQIITINSASTALRVTQTGAGNIVLFEDAANPDTTPFVIDNAGNVGIGLTTPTEKLDVVGNIKTTGSIIFEGTQDAYELTLTTSDPLADNTITFPSSTGTVALTNNKLSAFAATTSAELKTVISDETGTGLLVFNDGPTINNLNLTGQVTGLELAFGNSIVFEGTTADDYELTLTAGDPTADRTVTLPNATTTLVGKDTTDVLTNKTLSDATTFIVDSVDNTKKINIDVTGTSGITGVLQTAFTSAKTVSFPDSTGTVALTNNKLSDFASTTSSELAGVISDETGTGALVFANTPTLVTPVLGVASATSINKVAITTPATGSTITVADGKTLTASNTLTFTGTDASSVAFGTGGTVAYTGNKLSVFAATTSTELAGVISDETGSGSLVFANTPTLITPVLGVATATSINGTSIPSSKTLVVTTDIGSSVQAWDADLDSIAALAGTAGFLKKTSTNTWTLDTTSYLSGVVAIASGGTGQTTANAALNALLPSQTTATNKYLMSNGTDAAWTTVDALPSQTGNTGKYLTTNGTSASWEIVDLLPSQAGNSGKFLTTNGTVASWALTSGGYAQSSPPTSPAEGAVWLDIDGTTNPVSVDLIRWTQTVATTTTTFTGNGDGAFALSYTPGTEQVYLNGVMLIRGSDYSGISGTSIVLVTAAVAGDILQVITLPAANLSNAVNISTFTTKGDLVAASASGLVNRLGVGGNGTFLVADSAQTLGLAWSNTITIASGTTVPLTIQNNGTGNSFVVNDVASDTTPFVIDASGNVGIGTTSPGGKLDVNGVINVLDGGSYVSVPSNSVGGAGVIFRGDSNAASRWFQIVANTSAYGILDFTASSTNEQTGLASKMVLTATGRLGIGTSAPNKQLTIVSAASTAMQVSGNGGATYTEYGHDNDGGYIYQGSDSKPFRIFTGNALRFNITSDGATTINSIADATTTTAARGAGYMGIPQSAASGSGSYTIVAADAGEHIYTTTTRTVTIPANGSVAFPIGTVLSFISGPGATTTISITTDTMYLSGLGTTGTRTLAAHGMATAVKVAATTWYISGNGLT